MGNKGHSTKGFFGDIHHYDEHGRKTGTSSPGIFGGYTNYDAKGNKIGHSSPGLFGGYTNYDAKGNKTGNSSPGIFGGYNHYDNNGKNTGHTDPALFGGYNHYDSENNSKGSSSPSTTGSNNQSSDGCYVATCVYGSYDCPQVWTLRRYRDDTLAKTWYGRAFIHAYYAISPMLVKWFGDTNWFKNMWHGKLDHMVSKLQANGVESTPYEDKNWRNKV